MATQVSLNSGAVASAGALSIQTNGTTEAVGISTGQVATLAQNPVLTSGTANGVPYLNGSKVLTSGSALTFDGTNFGVGTSSPAEKLSMYDASALGLRMDSPDSIVRFMQGATTKGYIRMIGGTTNRLQLVNNTNELTLDSAGNLGLGVTPSAWSNSKAIQVGALSSLSNNSNLGSSEVINNAYQSAASTYTYLFGGNASLARQVNGQHQWYTAPSGTAGNAITFTQAMTLDASGQLGVGTTSPSSAIEAAANVSGGSFTLTSTNTSSANNTTKYSGLKFRGVDTVGTLKETAYIQVTPADANYVGSSMLFYTRSSDSVNERARIDSSGNLLVGTTSSSVGGLAMKMVVNTSSDGIGVIVPASATPQAMRFAYGATAVGSIICGPSSTTYNTSSDYRLKDITGPVTGEEAKNFIMALHPKQGSWKADGSKFVGFVAHEFQEVSPTSVSGTKDAVDEDGNPVMQSMQASSPEVMANLVALIQEQQAIIEQLKSRLDAANL